MHVAIDVVLPGYKHGQEKKHEMNPVVDNVHIRLVIPDHVTDMHVNTGERRSMESVGAQQVGQEPAVNQVGKYE